MAIVYLATNQVNGKHYIGATSRGLARRRIEHRDGANTKRTTCRYFHAAVRKYGIDAFAWTVLASCETFEEALLEEVRLIAELKPEYNLTLGGQGSRGTKMTPEGRERWLAKMIGRKHSSEHIEKCRLARIGTRRTPEQRERMGAARRGKQFSAEHRRNLSVSHTGKKQSPELIEKRVAPRLGKPLTPEHRAKVSAAISRVWAGRRLAAEATNGI